MLTYQSICGYIVNIGHTTTTLSDGFQVKDIIIISSVGCSSPSLSIIYPPNIRPLLSDRELKLKFIFGGKEDPILPGTDQFPIIE